MRQHAVSHGGSLIGDKLDLVIASEVVGLVRFLLQTSDQEWRDAVNQGLNEALCSPVLKVRVRVRVRVSAERSSVQPCAEGVLSKVELIARA